MNDELRVFNAICRENFAAFSARAFREVNPGVKLEWSWHLDLLCLSGDSRLLTPMGEMSIKDIVQSKYSGYVLSFNHKKGKAEWRRVTGHSESDGVLAYNLTSCNNVVLRMTHNHPVWSNGTYKKAENIYSGDTIMCLLPKEFRKPFFKNKTKEVLLNAMLRTKQDKERKAYLPKLRKEKKLGWFNMQGLPRLSEKNTSKGSINSLRELWGVSLQDGWCDALCAQNKGCFLQLKMLRKIYNWCKQSGLYRWWEIGCLSQKWIQIKEKESNKKGWKLLLSLQIYTRKNIGCSSYRQKQREQRGLESCGIMQTLSQSAKRLSRRNFKTGECTVREITKSVRVSEKVYNIAVEGNNNYFANGILVHNCDHLQALHDGTLGKRRLAINVPPRTLKSFLSSIAYPAWVMGKKASDKFICTSFNATLAKEMSQKSRIIFESDWYKSIFPETVIDDRQNEKHNFWTTQRGMYYSSAIKSVTGRGTNTIVIDDPLNPKEAVSPTIREDTNETIRSTLPSRFNDPRDDKWLLIMQRLHENDPTGNMVLNDDRWYHIKLPAENLTGKDIVYELNGKKWVFKAGDLLFPARLTREVLDDLREDMMEYHYVGQYLQEPAPIGGGEFRHEWIQYYQQGGIRPKEMNVCILVDPSGGDEMNKKKKKVSDWSAFVVIGMAPDNNYYLLDVIRDRLNPTDRVDTLFMLHRKWNQLTGKPPKVGYEKYGMMSDTHYIREKQKQEGYNFPIIEVGGNVMKEERIRRLIPDMQSGRWYFPSTMPYVDSEGRHYDLVKEIIEGEMKSFPRSRYDDCIDAISRIYEEDLFMTFPRPKIGMVKQAVMGYNSENTSQSWEDF